MRQSVAIVGVGLAKFGKRTDASLRDLAAEAIKAALEDAEISPKDVNALVVGNYSSDRFVKQGHLGPLIADYVGMLPRSAWKVESACASGGAALRVGSMMILSGAFDVVVVCGVEKMTDVAVSEATDILNMAADTEWEGIHGITFPGEYAMMAVEHMHRFGTTEEQLARVAVKNHRNAMENPFAHFHRVPTIEEILKSKVVAYPLKLWDCSPISDGAAALILASEDTAKKIGDTPVWIAGFGSATDTIALHDRADITSLQSAVTASREAYDTADVRPRDVDVAEVHDCFTIAELMAYEDLGLCEKGCGGKLIEEGETEVGGRIPVNPSGGLKAKGHPVGATGVAQAVEVALQLRGEAGQRQVKGAEVGLTHNVGGTGSSCFVHILKR